MDSLLDLEERGWQAMSSTSPTDFFEEWLADDVLMVVPGMVIDRDTFLAAVRGEPPWKTHLITEPRVITFTDECAALLYQVTAQRDGQAPYVALMTSVYARRNGSWRLVLHQQTPAPPA
jgi:hypothetical protein